MGITHNAPIARAATKTGSNEAIIKTWLSAAIIARKRNARKRKNAVPPECRPFTNHQQAILAVQAVTTYNRPIADQCEQQCARKEERNVDHSIGQYEGEGCVQPIFRFAVIHGTLFQVC